MSVRKIPIDVIWLVEHAARELDVACAAAAILKAQYGLTVQIRNLYYHTEEILCSNSPKMVVHPFFYVLRGALATEDIVFRFPEAIHLNLAWEQIHYKAHVNIKAPSDEFSKKNVIHHAWGGFYQAFLLNAGVDPQNIFLNGQPALQLYRRPYCGYYKSRSQLAVENGLDEGARWVFVPENFRWAFIGSKIKQFLSLGGNEKDILELRDYCIESLKLMLQWCSLAATQLPGIEIIFRPRPAVNSHIMTGFFQEHVGEIPPRLHFNKKESVREWILASDVVISSYSTSLIEAAIANKPLYMFESIPFPESLHCDWYAHAPRIRSHGDFREACYSPTSCSGSKLKEWAETTLCSTDDPIQSLSDHIAHLVRKTPARQGISQKTTGPTGKKYFNETTHEMDVFSDVDIASRVERWNRCLGLNDCPAAGIGPINKSMHRGDLLSGSAEITVRDLNSLIRTLHRNGLWMSSWVGTLPQHYDHGANWFKKLARTFIAKMPDALVDPIERKAIKRGMAQRLDYEPLPDAADDQRHPWFLYWEIYWVLRYMRPRLKPGAKILDAGGSSSLFTCYLASLGYEVHCVELNANLNANAQRIADKMKWNLFAYDMNLQNLKFADKSFDHAFSICVFEHLDYPVKKAALAEIARCLNPGGILSITFDYKNPAPGVVGFGKDTRPQNQISNPEDLRRSFLSTEKFELVGNQLFYDSGESYLTHPMFPTKSYTFGSIFLRRVED
jgi:surface carbohydrate biosynthesis protein